jgi:hypothetical protein
MKKIKLGNGDFITVDEAANKTKEPKEPDGVPSKEMSLVLFAAGVVFGALLIANISRHMNNEEVKQITEIDEKTN